ncbi:MAG: Asp-tRNA(Asn)/Glu-tRNA(Gln) amidotransferase subunit GatB [Clostridia bacterium]|nr:Asp-tRNA(Asn)/Glu-tRNA(Gln) amidotransferase subunit GatB [Clostridia bacterium]
MRSDYEAVIGLEVHAELKTATKIFCACPTSFGAPPNTHCCPVCLGLPGTLPVLNRRAVELAVIAGLALDCEIAALSRTDRKQYFYPDLPKGYQISQAETSICRNGHLTVTAEDGAARCVGIERIHIEEDAGKLVHEGNETLVDCNRCGVPLIEIVSRPDLRGGAEATAYLKALREILLACGVSDCRMQEGSLRCDVNISVRRSGEETFGVRTEIKNINSFAFVEKAIAYETARQIGVIENGGAVVAETRRYDEARGETVRMRVKETAEDYRYLAEPDMLPIRLTDSDIARLRAQIPELPSARAERLEREYGMTAENARILVSELGMADYFEAGAKRTQYPKLLVNLLLSELLRHCEADPFVSPIRSEALAELADLLGERTVNSATGKKLLSRMLTEDISPRKVAYDEGLTQITDAETIGAWVDATLTELPRAVEDYRSGKSAAIKSLQGRVMAMSRGRADPIICEQLLLEKLKSGDKTI